MVSLPLQAPERLEIGGAPMGEGWGLLVESRRRTRGCWRKHDPRNWGPDLPFESCWRRCRSHPWFYTRRDPRWRRRRCGTIRHLGIDNRPIAYMGIANRSPIHGDVPKSGSLTSPMSCQVVSDNPLSMGTDVTPHPPRYCQMLDIPATSPKTAVDAHVSCPPSEPLPGTPLPLAL